jgi:hypothetical protein
VQALDVGMMDERLDGERWMAGEGESRRVELEDDGATWVAPGASAEVAGPSDSGAGCRIPLQDPVLVARPGGIDVRAEAVFGDLRSVRVEPCLEQAHPVPHELRVGDQDVADVGPTRSQVRLPKELRHGS